MVQKLILVGYHSTQMPIVNYVHPNRPFAVYHEAMIQSILALDHQFHEPTAWLSNACVVLCQRLSRSQEISHPSFLSD